MSESRKMEHRQGTDLSFIEAEYTAVNSIELTRNAKGDYQWSIKLYYRPDEDWKDIVERIREIDLSLHVMRVLEAVLEESEASNVSE